MHLQVSYSQKIPESDSKDLQKMKTFREPLGNEFHDTSIPLAPSFELRDINCMQLHNSFLITNAW